MVEKHSHCHRNISRIDVVCRNSFELCRQDECRQATSHQDLLQMVKWWVLCICEYFVEPLDGGGELKTLTKWCKRVKGIHTLVYDPMRVLQTL